MHSGQHYFMIDSYDHFQLPVVLSMKIVAQFSAIIMIQLIQKTLKDASQQCKLLRKKNKRVCFLIFKTYLDIKQIFKLITFNNQYQLYFYPFACFGSKFIHLVFIKATKS